MGDPNLVWFTLTGLTLTPGKIPLTIILIAYIKNRPATEDRGCTQ
jgi:hypothetical protein